MNELALFAGAGGGILGGKLLGWRTVCAVEIEPYPTCVLIQRQNEGILDPFPIWDDVCTFDGKPWRGIIDVVSGGFPCQDVSAIGHGKGLSGKRSGLWFQFARIIDEVRPRFAFVENSPVLRKRGLDQVLANLAEIGYDAEWLVLGADDCGIPQKRKRMWVLAYPHRIAEQESFGNNQTLQQERNTWVGVEGSGDRRRIPMSYAAVAQFAEALSSQSPTRGSLQLNASEPGMGRVVNDVANRVDRLTAIGNGQVPAVAATAWTILMDRIYKN